MAYLKNMFLAALLCCFFWSNTAAAYNGALEDVTVTGTAQMEAACDTALVEFGICGQGDGADEAAAAAADRAAAVKRALAACGILPDELENVSYVLRPVYNEKGRITGYRADNTLRVTVNDMQKLGTVIDKLAAAGADRIGSVQLTVRGREKLQRMLLAEAVADAKKQAELLAAAGGRSLGRMLSVSADNSGDFGRAYRNMAAAKADGTATVIEAGTIKISVSVRAIFALE